MTTDSTKPDAGYWQMSTYLFAGQGLKNDRTDDAWHVDWPLALQSRMWQAVYQEIWDESVVLPIYRGKHCRMQFPDMPISQPVQICSNRTRQLLEKLAPMDIQYLPVQLEHKGKPIGEGQHWIMNLLHIVDCVDEGDADWRYHTYTKGKMYETWTIDPSRVPNEVRIFRVKGAQSPVVVTDGVRSAVEQARITGVGFGPLGHLFSRAPDWKPGPLEPPPS